MSGYKGENWVQASCQPLWSDSTYKQLTCATEASSILINLVLSSKPNKFLAVKIVSISLSDHDIIVSIRKITIKNMK